ncbi:MAG: hypothetical protein SOV26_03845 [Candidatus Onthovivens sp.]|nr:hypothetical protein [Candidatus Onthovivens sp.]
MVSKLLLVVTSIFLSSSIATNTNSFSPEASIKKVASVGTLKDENWVPYYYDDFERFSLDATQDDIFNNSFIGMQTANVASIDEHDGHEKALKLRRSGENTFAYIGSGYGMNGLDKLVRDKRYKISMYLDFEITEGSQLWIEYASNWWVNVYFDSDGTVHSNGDATFNISYVSKKLSFEFCGQPTATSFKFTLINGDENDVVYVDDIVISSLSRELYDDFSTYNVGTAVDYSGSETGTIAHFWNGQPTEAIIDVQEGENGKYLSVRNDKAEQNWQAFFYNHLDPIFAGTMYTVELEFTSLTWDEAYLFIPGNWVDGGAGITISPDGTVNNAVPSKYIDCTFINNAFSLTYLASTDYQSDQVHIILRNPGAADNKISRVALYETNNKLLNDSKFEVIEAVKAISTDPYFADEAAKVGQLKSNAIFKLMNSIALDDIKVIYDNLLTEIASIKTSEQILSEAKEEKYALLDAVNLEVYSSTNKTVVINLINTAKSDIATVSTVEEINSIYDAFVTNLEGVPTLLDDEKTNAIKTLDAINLENYEGEDVATIQGIITTAKAQINSATSSESIQSILTEALSQIHEVPTSEVRLAKAKEEALAVINEFDTSKYSGDSLDLINSYINIAKQAINEATTREGVSTALSEFMKSSSAVPTALEEAKTKAIATLDAVDLSIYEETEKVIVEGYITSGKNAIEAATTVTEVENTLKSTLESIDAVLTHDEKLSAYKYEAIARVNSVETSAYSSENAAKITAEKEKTVDAIKTATAYDEIDSAVGVFFSIISTIPTLLDEEKVSAKATLDETDLTLYRDAQKATVQDIIDTAKEAIDAAETFENITSILNKALEDISKVPTNTQLTLQEAKTSAINEINTYYDEIDLTKYSKENKEKITSLANKARSDVEASTSVESVNTIVSAFKIAVEAIEKLPASSGCGGSITATSIVLSGLALAAIALLTYKKVKEN